MPQLKIGFFIYPGVTALDVVGPAQVLSQLPEAKILFVAQSQKSIPTDAGFTMLATHTFEECGQLDIICIPGGPGQSAVMHDEAVLSFVNQQGLGARYVTSVCTGSLLLAKAGLLEGRRAACHWAWRDALSDWGAKPQDARVVEDRNRITGGGVTAGIDFGLSLVAKVAGEQTAQAIQLGLEYRPEPPFDAGSPETTEPAIVARVKALFVKHYALT